jgi:hypothetical protein
MLGSVTAATPISPVQPANVAPLALQVLLSLVHSGGIPNCVPDDISWYTQLDPVKSAEKAHPKQV